MIPGTISVPFIPQKITKFMFFIKTIGGIHKKLCRKSNVLVFSKLSPFFVLFLNGVCVTCTKTILCMIAIEYEQVNFSLFRQIAIFWYSVMEMRMD